MTAGRVRVDPAAALRLLLESPPAPDADDLALSAAEAAAGLHGVAQVAWRDLQVERFRGMLAEAWEEGRGAARGAMNPTGPCVSNESCGDDPDEGDVERAAWAFWNQREVAGGG